MISLTKPYISKGELQAVARVLKSGYLVQGEEVEKLEKEFARHCRVRYAVAVSSGTAALHLALLAVGIKEGDEVITTPFTFVATVNAILMIGATPVFADIREDTYNIDPQKIEEKITKKTAAILVVNLYGQAAEYGAIWKIAKKHNLFVVEDAAQSVGGSYRRKVSGSLGDISCFSLYATKNIMSGEGGIVTTNSKKFDSLCRMMRNHGQSKKRYEYVRLGYNYRMTDIEAALARVQLKKLKILTKTRQKKASLYMKKLKEIKGLILPKVEPGATHVFHQFTLRVTGEYKHTRDKLQRLLHKRGIITRIYYPVALNNLPYLKKRDVCEVAQKLAREILSIPVHPLLTAREQNYIINAIKSI